jgi:hypothetical protein
MSFISCQGFTKLDDYAETGGDVEQIPAKATEASTNGDLERV